MTMERKLDRKRSTEIAKLEGIGADKRQVIIAESADEEAATEKSPSDPEWIQERYQV